MNKLIDISGKWWGKHETGSLSIVARQVVWCLMSSNANDLRNCRCTLCDHDYRYSCIGGKCDCCDLGDTFAIQKERVGASQPVGIGIGGLVMLPYYVIPLDRSVQDALQIGLVLGISIGAASIAMLFLSGRLIRREKLLPWEYQSRPTALRCSAHDF